MRYRKIMEGIKNVEKEVLKNDGKKIVGKRGLENDGGNILF